MSEWISVKDRLPCEFETVLVGRSEDHDCPCTREALHMRNGEFCMPLMNVNFENPTHWMPLPAPPKGE